MNTTMQNLCEKLRECYFTGVKDDVLRQEVGGSVIPFVPKAHQGIEVLLEDTSDDTFNEITISPERTDEKGVVLYDIKRIAELFDPLVYNSAQEGQISFMGHFQGDVIRVKINLSAKE
jgi:hypothetical protein